MTLFIFHFILNITFPRFWGQPTKADQHQDTKRNRLVLCVHVSHTEPKLGFKAKSPQNNNTFNNLQNMTEHHQQQQQQILTILDLFDHHQWKEARSQLLRILVSDSDCVEAIMLIRALRSINPLLFDTRHDPTQDQLLQRAKAVPWDRKQASESFITQLAEHYHIQTTTSTTTAATSSSPTTTTTTETKPERGGAAAFLIGVFKFHISGLKEQAIQWYKIAAEKGNSSAQNNLALCFTTGQGVEKNIRLGKELFQMAAEQGHAVAQQNFGLSLLESDDDVPRRSEEAVSWIRKSAEQGYVDAVYTLASCFLNGEGVKYNPEEAVKLYQMAATKFDDPMSCYRLGSCYWTGTGTNTNKKEAMKWWRERRCPMSVSTWCVS